MTTKLPPETYLGLWQSASEQEFGLCITCVPDEQMKLVNAIYAARQEFGGFENLMLFQPQPPGTIYIMKKTVELPE